MINKITICIIDDHKVLTDGLEVLLHSKGYLNIRSINSVINIDHILHEISEEIVILDINLNGHNGLDILKNIHDNKLNAKVIILSSYRDVHIIRTAMKYNCAAYLTKQTASDHILEAIQVVSRGKQYFDPSIQSIITKSFAGLSIHQFSDSEKKIISMLSRREIEVLRLIASQYSSEEIGELLFISKSTVDTHRKNLIQKLKVKNSIGLALIAKQNSII